MKEYSEWLFKPEAIKAESLEMNTDMYEAILSCVQDGISVLKPDFSIVYVNKAMRQWYQGGEDIIGNLCYKVYHSSAQPCLNCPTRRAIRTSFPQMELVPADSHTESGWQKLYAVPVLNAKGETTLIIEYVRDVTIQKRVETNMNELANMYEGLEAQNDALMEILKQRDVYKEDLEQTITDNFEKFVRPALDYIKKNAPTRDVDILSGIIDEILYPITKKRPSLMDRLTPRELQICALIKEGFTSKEIADKLIISKRTVDFHRNSIRSKLELNGENLRAYLEARL